MEREPAYVVVEEGVRLRPIGLGDLEFLRESKNRNKESFFHREEISPDQQAAWFAEFMTRPDDHMFVVQVDGVPVGCMGYRLGTDDLDFYNIIRSSDTAPGVMHKALRSLIDVALERYPAREVQARVLVRNPAIGWYQRCGFRIVQATEDYVLMQWTGSPN